MSIILFLVILALLIISHEFGHFIVAKKSGIRVDEFAIGFPPKLFSWRRGETLYSINLLPFGGYVKIFGEDPDDKSIAGPDSARSITAKSRYVQSAVVLSGVLFNFLLAWFLFSFGFFTGTPATLDGAPASAKFSDVGLTITQVLPNSPANEAGLKVGDKIINIGTLDKKLEILTPDTAREFIASHGDQKLALEYKEGKGETNVAILMPIKGIVEDKVAIGVSFEMAGTLKLPIIEAIWQGGKHTVNLTVLTAEAIFDLIKKAAVGKADLAALTGPVGIVGLVGTASDFGFAYLISFIALISINLGVLNLIPFPALDGGRFLFIVLEGIIRRPIPYKFLNIVNALGFVFLIGLMIMVTYQDIAKLLLK